MMLDDDGVVEDGASACNSVGVYADFVKIEKDACFDGESCSFTGFFGNEVEIGQGACRGNEACVTMTGTVKLLSDACVGDSACSGIGGGGQVDIGLRACNGVSACFELGIEADTVDIEADACVGKHIVDE